MSKIEVNELEINGVVYVPKSSSKKMATNTDGMEYVIIRSRNAGVHAGYLKKEEGQEVVLIDSTRIWAWYGAATLSQLAMEGVKKPDECKFGMKLPEIRLKEVCEVIPCTEKAREIIRNVKEWKI